MIFTRIVLCSGADFLLCDACSERTLQQCSRQSEATGKCIERVTIVIDAAGWHIGLAGWTAMKYLKSLADTDSAHYPERLGAIFVSESAGSE